MVKKCELKFCNNILNLHKHHIQSKSKGGEDKKYNIAYICPNCHDQVHRSEIIIEGRFETTNGNMVIYRFKDEPSITNKPDPIIWTFDELKNNKKYDLDLVKWYHQAQDSLFDFLSESV